MTIQPPRIIEEVIEGRTRYIVNGLRYPNRKAAERALARAQERDREHEIIARLAREAGRNRRG